MQENKKMAERQIKSKSRVKDHGEVFTAEREVKAMCDLAKDETERIDSRVLEPACGDGNFLAEILKRKLKTVNRYHKNNPNDWEKYSIVALSSLYGVDIQEDNIEECKARLFNIWLKTYKKAIHSFVSPDIDQSAKYILSCNIICGDALTLLKSDGNPIVFSEWSLVSGTLMKRRDFELSTLLSMQENGKQGDLFLSSDDFDSELGAYIPKPIKEFNPIEYWRLQCLK